MTHPDIRAGAPSGPGFMARRGDLLVQSALAVLAVVAFLAALKAAEPFVVPLFFAIFITVVLRRPTQFLVRIGLPRVLAALVIVLCTIGVLGGLAAVTYKPAFRWFERAPEIAKQLDSKLFPIRKQIEKAEKSAAQLEAATDLSKPRSREVVVRNQISLFETVSRHALLTVAELGLVLVLIFYLLARGPDLVPNVVLSRGSRLDGRIRLFLRDIDREVGRYLGLTTLINICVGGAMAAVLWGFGMPNPILWGVVLFALNYIPYVGPIVGVVLLTILGALTFSTLQSIALPVVIYLAIVTLESEMITPLILVRFLTLNPITIILSILLWSWMWGMAGALLAVPILVSGRIAMRVLAPGFAMDESKAKAQPAPSIA